MQGAENVWRIDQENELVQTIQPLPKEGYDKLRFNWNAPMALSSSVPDRIYMGSQYLHQSDDMGNTWKIISPDLTTNDPLKQDQDNSGGLSQRQFRSRKSHDNFHHFRIGIRRERYMGGYR